MKTLDQIGKEIIAFNGVFREIVAYSLPQYKKCSSEEISFLIHANNPAFDPLDPNSKIIFLGTEETNGKTRFDSYYALSQFDSAGEIACYINIEVQGKRDNEQLQKAREKVYLTRMIQEQKDAIRKMDYANIQGVASIWIYPNTNEKQMGKILVEPMTVFDYTEGVIKQEQPIDFDFSMMVVSIYLGRSDNPLIQLLNHCFDTKQIKESAKYLKEHYGLELESEVTEMCTLDEYKINLGRKEGIKEGTEETMISNLKNIMSSLAIGLNEAMNLLKLTAEEKQKYRELMSK